jgi:hypothetical protein
MGNSRNQTLMQWPINTESHIRLEFWRIFYLIHGIICGSIGVAEHVASQIQPRNAPSRLRYSPKWRILLNTTNYWLNQLVNICWNILITEVLDANHIQICIEYVSNRRYVGSMTNLSIIDGSLHSWINTNVLSFLSTW